MTVGLDGLAYPVARLIVARVNADPQPGPGLAASLVDALPEPSFVVASGRILVSNAAARAVLGDRIDAADVRLAIRHPAALDRLLGDAPMAADEVELVGLGGPERRWMMSVRPLAGGWRFVRLADRSEAHAAERMRVDFVANASHELRTPLATLVGYAETLRDAGEALDAATRERFTAIVHDEARRMQRLVEDLISLSRIEGEKFSPPTDAIDIAWLLDETKRGAANAAAERGCTIEIAVPAGLPPVAGDRAQLLQLYDNLVGNALRYGRAGGTVRIVAAAEGATIRTAVSDEGEGIAKEHVPRLTERFYRVDTGRSRSAGGTGLGLSIVKHIVERHRGRLAIESEPGTGTVVAVTLPAAPAADARHQGVTAVPHNEAAVAAFRRPPTEAYGTSSPEAGGGG
jgi:two-component system phosphate regulon sensor histidine kinase PhoR